MQALNQQSLRSGTKVAGSQQARPTIVLLPRGVQPPSLSVQQCTLSIQAPARCVISRSASKLGDVSLFGGDTSSLLGGGPLEEAKSKQKVEDVPLESEVGMDYTVLRDALNTGDFLKADDETRALLIRLAGEGAIKRGWVYFTEVKTIGNKDLQTIDNLWKTASNGKFGYSVQKEIFNQQQKRWGKFFKQIDWTQGENNNYRKWPMEFTYTTDAPKGHLPLTSCLRGTQLFENILNHPAWEKTSTKQSIDDTAKAAGANTLKW